MSVAATQEPFDAIVIGYGPVGQMLAARLGRAGRRVAVFERQPSLYGLSRAVHCDDEIVRLLQDLGVAEEFVADASPLLDYDWRNGDDELLLHFDWSAPGPSGWLGHYFDDQPRLERLLDRVARACPGVEVHHGWDAVALHQDDDGAALTVRELASGRERTVRAPWLIGADGANSFARATIGAAWEDRGFEEQWLVADVRPHDPDVVYPMLESGQLCDPARPTTMFRWMGRTYCRWEFMKLPGEDPEELASAASAWRLLERWGPAPGNAELIRHTVYTFRSCVADRWRDRRVLLAGDAAHLMPPFMGQGLASGLRDAANLAWKLDLVLDGGARPELLDAYERERRPHVTEVIDQSVALGRVVCVSDPEEAAARDRRYRSGEVPLPPPFPQLTDGVLLRDDDGRLAAAAGTRAIQGPVRHRNRSGRFDDVVGRGWVVLWRRGDPLTSLTDADRALLDRLGAVTVRVTPAVVAGAATDLEHRYDRWLRQLGHDLVVLRPDHYVYGGVADSRDLPRLLASLRRQLALD